MYFYYILFAVLEYKRKLNFFLVLYAILTTYIVYIKFCVEI